MESPVGWLKGARGRQTRHDIAALRKSGVLLPPANILRSYTRCFLWDMTAQWRLFLFSASYKAHVSSFDESIELVGKRAHNLLNYKTNKRPRCCTNYSQQHHRQQQTVSRKQVNIAHSPASLQHGQTCFMRTACRLFCTDFTGSPAGSCRLPWKQKTNRSPRIAVRVYSHSCG